jgi:hypothetical protein
VPPAGFIVLSIHVSKAEGSEAWRNFCRQGQCFLRAGAIAVQSLWRPLLSPGAEVCWRAVARIRVQRAR